MMSIAGKNIASLAEPSGHQRAARYSTVGSLHGNNPIKHIRNTKTVKSGIEKGVSLSKIISKKVIHMNQILK
jgi:hypothetical protein